MRTLSTWTLCVALATATIAIGAPPAHADDKAEASRHFKLGVSLYGEGKFDEALVEFQRAYEIAPHPSVLFNIAETYRELSRYNDSIEYFERFLQEGKGKAKKDLLAKAQKELDELKLRIGSVKVDVKPDGVAVSVDGKDLGTTPLAQPLILGIGQHRVELRAPWGAVKTEQVTVTAGDTTTLTEDLGEAPKEPPPPPPDGGGTTGDHDQRFTDTVVLKPVRPPEVRRRAGVSAAMATNALLVSDTGAPEVGLSVGLGRRVALGVDVVLVAWAVVPSLRVVVAGPVYAVAAVPVAFTDGDASETFVAGAGGLGVRIWAAPKLAIRAEALVSFAGGDHGVTVPVSLGAELWF